MTEPNIDRSRLQSVKDIIAKYGDKIPLEVQRSILSQRVSIGMPPYEAYLAAGQCTFKVIADPLRWPQSADPFKVIQAQTLHPDNSQIWMVFENETQFPENGKVRFKVYVSRGKVISIEPLEPAK